MYGSQKGGKMYQMYAQGLPPAVHLVHVAAPHVHLAHLVPAKQPAVELVGLLIIGGHELMPGHAAERRRTIPTLRRTVRLVDTESRALRIRDEREPADVRNVLRTDERLSTE